MLFFTVKLIFTVGWGEIEFWHIYKPDHTEGTHLYQRFTEGFLHYNNMLSNVLSTVDDFTHIKYSGNICFRLE